MTASATINESRQLFGVFHFLYDDNDGLYNHQPAMTTGCCVSFLFTTITTASTATIDSWRFVVVFHFFLLRRWLLQPTTTRYSLCDILPVLNMDFYPKLLRPMFPDPSFIHFLDCVLLKNLKFYPSRDHEFTSGFTSGSYDNWLGCCKLYRSSPVVPVLVTSLKLGLWWKKFSLFSGGPIARIPIKTMMNWSNSPDAQGCELLPCSECIIISRDHRRLIWTLSFLS